MSQVDAILHHISEPLVSLQVGELTRSLFPNPRQLIPNGKLSGMQCCIGSKPAAQSCVSSCSSCSESQCSRQTPGHRCCSAVG